MRARAGGECGGAVAQRLHAMAKEAHEGFEQLHRRAPSGARLAPSSFCVLATSCIKSPDLDVTEPATMSEWPPMYLVAEWIATSTPGISRQRWFCGGEERGACVGGVSSGLRCPVACDKDAHPARRRTWWKGVANV
eukprot:3405129-Prymnesium_polylepis.1